jgi:hypothetical protein
MGLEAKERKRKRAGSENCGARTPLGHFLFPAAWLQCLGPIHLFTRFRFEHFESVFREVSAQFAMRENVSSPRLLQLPEGRRDSGRGAALLHKEMKRRSVNRPLLLRRKDRTGKGSAHFQPGAERPGFLAHQVVMAGIGTLKPMDKDPFGLGIVIPQLEHSDFRGPQAGVIGQPEDGSIANGRNHGEQPINLLLAQERDRLLARLTLVFRLVGLIGLPVVSAIGSGGFAAGMRGRGSSNGRSNIVSI